MKLLELVAKEFLSIVQTLENNEPVENNRIVIEKSYFKELLEKYHYMKFAQKVKIYKDLNFIIHDKSSYTMPCKDSCSKKAVRKVVINYETFNTLKYLYDCDIEV